MTSLGSSSRSPASERITLLSIIAAAASLLMIAFAGCSNRAVRSASCDVLARDSVFAATGPVYHECAVDTKAKLVTPGPRPEFQPPARTTCYSAEIQFVVNQTGRVEEQTARVLHTNDQRFADAVLATLSAWKYEPAMLGGAPVRQIVETKQKIGEVVVRVPAGSVPRPPARGASC